jgi:hypothetical protein
MARRNQPYLPLFVEDFLTDEKLAECSAEATGVYVRLMCLMHKSKDYGKILLKQKYKQNDKQILNFASQVAKNMPYDLVVVERSLSELLNEDVLQVDGDFLIQKRMVKDAEISDKRAFTGKTGGTKAQTKKKFALNFAKANTEANIKANAENEIENETEGDIEIINEEKGDGTEEGEGNPYLLPAMLQAWKKHKSNYPEDREKDLPALLDLSQFICKQANAPYNPRDGECMALVLTLWEKWAVFVSNHDFFKRYSLAQVNTHSQNIFQSMSDGSAKRKTTNQQNQQPTGVVISGTKNYGKL